MLGTATTTHTPRYVLIGASVQEAPRFTAVFETREDDPLVLILITSPTNTPIDLSELRIRLNTLEPGYNLAHSIMINIRCIGQNNYVAGFEEANINASGETLHDALTNIKALMVDMYDLLSAANPRRLGPQPLNQRRILTSIIRKRQ